MDIPCPRCDEPWDNNSFHDEAAESNRTYTEVTRDFQSRGCHALETAFGSMICERSNSFRSMATSAMFDLCGDDIDGVASLMDDFEYMGMLD